MVNYKAIGGSAIGVMVISMLIAMNYTPTDNSYFCNATWDFCFAEFGLSGGKQTRCYNSTEVKENWRTAPYCPGGWLKVSDYVEVVDVIRRSRIEQNVECHKDADIVYIDTTETTESNCNIVKSVVEKRNNNEKLVDTIDIGNEKSILSVIHSTRYEYEYRDVCSLIPVFNISYDDSDEMVNFSSFGNCQTDGKCILCDHYLDGNQDRECDSGEHGIMWCIETDGLHKYLKNTKNEFVATDETFVFFSDIPETTLVEVV